MNQTLTPHKNVVQWNLNNQKDIPSHQNSQTEISMKELNGILVSPSFPDEVEAQIKARKRLRSNIQRFFASYCEITTTASVLRQRVIFLLCISLCSNFALEKKNTEKVIPILFGASYFCLSYQILENFIQYFSGKKKTNSGSQKMECIFKIKNRAALILSVLSFNLHYYGIIGRIFMLLGPLLFILEIIMYLRNPSISASENNDYMKITEKVFFVFQSFLIVAKINGFIDLEWKWTFVFVWIYLGIHAICVSLTGLLLVLVSSAAFLNLDIETLGLLKKKIIGYIWHISYYGLSIVCLVILVGIFQKIESNQGETLETGLRYAKKLSIFLVFYTVFLFPIIKKFKISPFEDLRITLQSQLVSGASRKKYSLLKTEDERKIAFFLMVSPTYFNLLADFSLENFEAQDFENPKEEENLCYICENSGANAILTECGHGGVCCECMVKLIEKKNECMECRKPAKAIYKIEMADSEHERGATVQASELVQILEV